MDMMKGGVIVVLCGVCDKRLLPPCHLLSSSAAVLFVHGTTSVYIQSSFNLAASALSLNSRRHRRHIIVVILTLEKWRESFQWSSVCERNVCCVLYIYLIYTICILYDIYIVYR